MSSGIGVPSTISTPDAGIQYDGVSLKKKYSYQKFVKHYIIKTTSEVFVQLNCSTQLSIECIMLINVKMPTIVI